VGKPQVECTLVDLNLPVVSFGEVLKLF